MKYIILFACAFTATVCSAQNFSTDIATAKTAYASGKLEDTHFALQQAMQEIDMIIGKQVLALLPATMGTLPANTSLDAVTTTEGFVGTSMHREWGTNDSTDFTLVSNSPLIGALNTMLNTPLLGGMMSKNGDSKIIKVQGYKAQLNRETEDNAQTNYTVLIPMGSSLVTFKANGCTDAQITGWANILPLAQIAKLVE